MRVEAAHHAGERDRLLRIGDDQILGRELAVHTVQRLQRLACAGAADDDRAALEQIKIEGVRRMPKFVQGIVGRVGGVVDRTRAQQFQPLHDQLRRRTDLHVANYAGGVSRAAFRVLDDDGELGCLELSSRPEASRLWTPERRDLRFPKAASARPASTRRCRWPTPLAPRRNGSWRRRDWWSGPSRKTWRHVLPRPTPRRCRPMSDPRQADDRQRGC